MLPDVAEWKGQTGRWKKCILSVGRSKRIFPAVRDAIIVNQYSIRVSGVHPAQKRNLPQAPPEGSIRGSSFRPIRVRLVPSIRDAI